jgi:hypothetical protein
MHFRQIANQPYGPAQPRRAQGAVCSHVPPAAGAPAEMHFRQIANQPYGTGQPRRAQGVVRSHVPPTAGAPAEMHFRQIANQPYGTGQPRRTQGPARSHVPAAATGARRDAFSTNRESTLWTPKIAGTREAACNHVPAAATGARRDAFSTNREPTLWNRTSAAYPGPGAQPHPGSGDRCSPRRIFNKSRTNPMDRQNRRRTQATVRIYLPAATSAARWAASAKNHTGAQCGPDRRRTCVLAPPRAPRWTLPPPANRSPGLGRRPPWRLRHCTAPPQPVHPDTSPRPHRPAAAFPPCTPAPPPRYAPRVQPGPARAKAYPPRVQEGAPNHAVT